MKNLYAKVTQRNDRGFTLIELLVVIAIIAVLAALVLAALSSAQKGSRDSKRKSDLNQYKTSLAQYASDRSGNFVSSGGAVNIDSTGGPLSVLKPDYYTAAGFATDPKSGQNYTYNSAGDTKFGICATLERKSNTMFLVGANGAREGAIATCPVDGDS